VASTGDATFSHRIISDHLRATSFLIADGVLPSNEGRGYVLRRIMRRAMRHAHLLGTKDPLMHRLVPALVGEMGSAYPELKRSEPLIAETLKLEEIRFRETLARGLKLLDEASTDLKKGDQLKGDVAFKLYDTYGFPLDLTEESLRARGVPRAAVRRGMWVWRPGRAVGAASSIRRSRLVIFSSMKSKSWKDHFRPATGSAWRWIPIFAAPHAPTTLRLTSCIRP
jgi:hypothetical protein